MKISLESIQRIIFSENVSHWKYNCTMYMHLNRAIGNTSYFYCKLSAACPNLISASEFIVDAVLVSLEKFPLGNICKALIFVHTF